VQLGGPKYFLAVRNFTTAVSICNVSLRLHFVYMSTYDIYILTKTNLLSAALRLRFTFTSHGLYWELEKV
jgi:short-subunit dehydrogenase involved in D-alanine esterification of teichoic acids